MTTVAWAVFGLAAGLGVMHIAQKMRDDEVVARTLPTVDAAIAPRQPPYQTVIMLRGKRYIMHAPLNAGVVSIEPPELASLSITRDTDTSIAVIPQQAGFGTLSTDSGLGWNVRVE